MAAKKKAPRTVRVEIRLTPDEARAWAEAAAADGLAVGPWIRMLAAQALRKGRS